jgi:hypothetical protein
MSKSTDAESARLIVLGFIGYLVLSFLLGAGLGYKIILLMIFAALGMILVNAQIGYRLGQLKHRPGVGAIAGLVLGLLGWIIVALLPDSAPPPREVTEGWRP